MRKPHNRKSFRAKFSAPASEPMLKRRRRIRYDDAAASEPSWSESIRDFAPDVQEFDMEVTGAGAIGGAAPVRPTQLAPTGRVDAAAESGLVAPQDEVQISSAARALGQIEPGNQLHEARLAEIRAAIADGTYETPQKLELAVSRLLEAVRNANG